MPLLRYLTPIACLLTKLSAAPLVISGGTLVSCDYNQSNPCITIDSGKIASTSSRPTDTEVIKLDPSWLILPGMIDIHTHGGYNHDTMDASHEALYALTQKLPLEGVTSFLPTAMTAHGSKIEATLEAIRDFPHIPGAEILGTHLEGPFISPEMAGAQPTEYMTLPDSALIHSWQNHSHNAIKLITLAPELPQAMEFISDLNDSGIILSIGHTNASYEQTQRALKAGCSHATHLFNRMRPIHHRDPGPITALLLDPHATVEIIADGYHLHPATVQLILKAKGLDRVIIVTDSMRAKGLPDGNYTLGSQNVTVKNGIPLLHQSNTLAGSTANMLQSAKWVYQNIHGVTLNDIVKMTSANPARLLNLPHKGSITEGSDADLIVIDQNFDLVFTVCKGHIFYNENILPCTFN